MDFLVYINRFLVALVFSIFLGSGATLAGVEEDYVKAKQSFENISNLEILCSIATRIIDYLEISNNLWLLR